MMSDKPTLNDILEKDDVEIADVDDSQLNNKIDDDNNNVGEEDSEKFCVECTDMPSSLHCINCDDNLCDVCYKVIHNSGKRKQHVSEKIENSSIDFHEDIKDETVKQPVVMDDEKEENEETTEDMDK